MSSTGAGLSALWYLTRVSLRRALGRMSGNDKAVVGTFIMAFAALAYCGIGYSFFKMTLHVAEAPELQELLPWGLETIVAMPLGLALFVGLMAAMSSANDQLYLSSDLDLLLSLPINRRAVMLSKVLSVWFAVAAIQSLLTLPAVLAYGANVSWWPLLPLYLVSLPVMALVPAAFAVFLLVVMGRFARSPRTRQALGVVGALIGGLIYVVMMTLQTRYMGQMGTIAENLARFMAQPGGSWLVVMAFPATWMAMVLHLFAQGNFAAGMMGVATAIALAVVLTWGLASAGAMAYAKGLTQRGGGRTRTGRRQTSRLERTAARPWQSGQLGGLLLWDRFILTRNPRLWQSMVFPVAWLCIYVVRNRDLFAKMLDPFSLGCIPATVSAWSASALVLMSFGIEGRAFYHLSSLPIAPRLRVHSKLLVFSLPGVLVGTLAATVLMARIGTAGDILRAVILVVAAAASAIALGLKPAIEGADFESINPGQIQASGAGCLHGFLLMVLIGTGYVALRVVKAGCQFIGLTTPVAETAAMLAVAAALLLGLVPYLAGEATAALRLRVAGRPAAAEGPPSGQTAGPKSAMPGPAAGAGGVPGRE